MSINSTHEDRQQEQLPQNQQDDTIGLILPTSGKIFYEQKDDYRFCKPYLLPLKSITLEKLEKMRADAQKQMQEVRQKQQL